jgi:hypothetical protein
LATRYNYFILLGVPISADVVPIDIPGRKQEWQYRVKYFGGDVQSFILPCISLPIEHMSLDEVKQRIGSAIRQIPHDDCVERLRSTEKNILELLNVKKDTAFIQAWQQFFRSIPMSSEHAHPSYFNALEVLAVKYGGKVKIREPYFVTYKR